MQISEFLSHRLAPRKEKALLVGVCGRAGAGKTTLVGRIATELAECSVPCATYSGDWRFILDSAERRSWLGERWRAGMDAYLDSVNQHRWWDFGTIRRDLDALRSGARVEIKDAYDRTTGAKTLRAEVGPLTEGILLYENAILGPIDIVAALDLIIVVNTPDHICLTRLLEKDASRRPVPEIATRYLMTTYSENTFLQALMERFADRTVACDANGTLTALPQLAAVTHIPVPALAHRRERRGKGTIFCDLDGTLIRHVAIPSDSGEEIVPLHGAIEKLRHLRADGYHVVLTTSRSHSKMIGIVGRLETLGLQCDQIITDLPIGPRHLINDNKDGEVRAIAHPLLRDVGLADVLIE